MSSFPFLKLPPELRRSIYQLILIREQQPLRPKTWGRGKHSRPTGQLTAILLTNRAIYREAHPILHSENKFEIEASYQSYQWLNNLGTRSRSELRNLKLLASDGNPWGTSLHIYGLLSQCANLALTINLHVSDLQDYPENGFLKHMHGFGQSSKGQTTNTTGEDCLHSDIPKSDLHERGDAILESLLKQHSDFPKSDLHERGDAIFESLLKQLASPCPPRCRLHGKTKMRPRASVSVECDITCYWCRYLRT